MTAFTEIVHCSPPVTLTQPGLPVVNGNGDEAMPVVAPVAVVWASVKVIDCVFGAMLRFERRELAVVVAGIRILNAAGATATLCDPVPPGVLEALGAADAFTTGAVVPPPPPPPQATMLNPVIVPNATTHRRLSMYKTSGQREDARSSA